MRVQLHRHAETPLRCLPGLQSREAGFTLIELLTVMAIAILLTALVIPSLQYTNSVQLRIISEEIANEIRLGLTLARTHGRTVRVTFNVASQSVVLAYDVPPRTPLKEPLALPAGIVFLHLSSEYLVCNPQGGFAQGLSTSNAYTTVLLDKRNNDRYYVIASLMSDRVRISRTPP